MVRVILFCLLCLLASQERGLAAETSEPERLAARLAELRGAARGPVYAALVDYYRNREPERAVRHAEAALAEAALAPADRAAILAALSYAEATRGRFPQALKAGIDAEALARELGREDLLSRALNNIGSVYFHQGQWQAALDYYQRSLGLAERMGDTASVVGRLNNIGNIYRELSQFEESLRVLRQAMDEARRAGVKYSLVSSNYGISLSRMGRHGEALPYLEGSLDEFRRDKSYLEASFCLEYLAQSEAALGRPERARAHLAEAKALAAEHGLAYKLPALHYTQARLDLDAGQPGLARRELEAGLAWVARLGRKADERRLVLLLARSLKAEGRDAEALAAYERHVVVSEDHFSQSLAENIALQQVSFASERKEHEIALLKRDNALKAVELEREQLRRRLGLGILGLAVLILGLVFLRYRLGRERRLNAELVRLNEEQRRLSAFKDQLLAKTSHELMTPLNGICGLVQLSLDEEGLEPELRQRLALILDCAQRLADLARDMLEHAQLQGGTARCQPEPVDPAQAAAQALGLQEPAARVKGLALENRVAGGLPAVIADPRRLQQILGNLLHNAIKFCERGSIVLDARLDGPSLVFRLCDQGPGIDPADRARIFEAYEQGDNSLRRAHGGAGLGLSLCKQLVELQGGRIGVDSEPGRGSCFWFSLPLAPSTDR